VKTRPVAAVALAAALAFGAAARALDAAHDAAASFPLAAGNAWTYEGTAHVPNVGVYEFFDVPVTLTMTATDEKRWGDVRLFIMEGHPDDASWALEGATVETGITISLSRYGLLCVGNRIFRVAGDDLEEVMVTTGAGGEMDVPFIAGGGPVLEVPLFVGARFGDYTRLTRADRNYFWYCADAAPYKGGRTAYHLVFASSTDKTDLWFVPGVGITRYEYAITGTPLAVKLALAEAALK
jgi:hypothetical protein